MLSIPPSRKLFAFTFFSLLIFAIYSNTFYASWQFDDRPNILNNYHLHINSLKPDKLINTFFTDPRNPEELSDRPYRPVSYVTFAVNWYFGQDHVVGYHVVNTVIHVFNAFFLFLFILNLLKTPNLRNYCPGNPFLIAFFASALWAANPIQTQAVTYIVQRMTQLAALFYLLGMLAYLKARFNARPVRRVAWLTLCLIFYLLGVNSKPNAAMMPMAILLLEMTFFQDLSDGAVKKKIIFFAAAIAGIIILMGSVVFLRGEPVTFFSDLYATRTFTLLERLLTQPRIILFYLSQIFYPLPGRLSIAHDVVMSSSFFNSWTTPASFLIIFGLILFSVCQIQTRPILSFSILFFFLNQAIESSIIPLELIFEHRNYLPSLFLFLPVACAFDYLMAACKHKNRILYFAPIGLLLALLCFFSVGTYIRNHAWKNEISLWMDAATKAPQDARVLNNLAIRMAWGDASHHPLRYDMALQLLETALDKNMPTVYFKADIYGNMALIHFYKKQNHQTGLQFFDKALEIYPDNFKIRRDLVNALINNKSFDEALRHTNVLISKNSENGIHQALKGHILLWKGEYEHALSCFQKAYDLVWDKISVIFNMSVALSLSGRHEKAEALLRRAIKHYPDHIYFYFAAIENSMRSGANNMAAEYKIILFDRFDRGHIMQKLEIYSDNPRYAPISREIIASVILSSN